MSLLWMFAITIAILQASVFCTTILLHRSITHRGIELNPVVRFLMHLHLSLFTGVLPREWAAVHRKHHHFSDKEGDPHSPYIYGLWNVLFLNYFYYRKECENPTTVAKYTPDYHPDVLDRIPGIRFFLAIGWVLFMLMFGWVWGTVAFVFHVLTYLILNSAVNSICHMIGYRNFDNLATNLQSVAFLTGGEGLHNNHHEHPTSARFALRRGEIDPAWPVIRFMELLRLAKVNCVPVKRAKAA